MTNTVTTEEDQVGVFIAVDHCPAECIGAHASRSGNRFEDLGPSARAFTNASAASKKALPRGWLFVTTMAALI
jgi:putative transposase